MSSESGAVLNVEANRLRYTPEQLAEKLETHKLLIPRFSLLNMRSCFNDVFRNNEGGSTTHRAPIHAGGLVINGALEKLKKVRFPEMRFSYCTSEDLVGVVGSFVDANERFNRIEVYEGGSMTPKKTVEFAPSIGFAALVATDGRSFAAAAIQNTGELFLVEKGVAKTFIETGLDRTFRCTDVGTQIDRRQS